MVSRKTPLLLLGVVVLLVFIAFLFGIPVYAQGLEIWTLPRVIPGLNDISLYPIFVADGIGTIHAFNTQNIGEVFSIVYSQWLDGVGWTYPIDIVESPRGDARITGAFLDKSGIMHLLFWGGDDLGANMYYTRAPLQDVRQSTAWEEPRLVGKSAIVPTTAALVGDGEGFLGVVYSGDIEGNGLYFIRSFDGGQIWSEPSIMFRTSDDRSWPSALQLYQAGDGQVHAVWSLADETGNSRAVYYARLESEREQWSDPVILAQAIEYEADTANIIDYQGQLFVIYHNGFPTTRWMRRSGDGGDTWTEPVRLFEQVGSNGAAAMVVDGDNKLHMFFGNRVGTPAIHGLWHSIWLGYVWSKPAAVASGPQIAVGPNGEEGFDPSFAQAVVNRGNQIFVVWRHDPMAAPQNIWYSYQYLDAPQETRVPYPALTPSQILDFPTDTPTIEETPIPAKTVTLDSPQPVSSEQGRSSPNITIIVSLIPIVLIVSLIVVVRRLTKRS